MAKVYYVVENGPDYSRVSFFKTEKEALEEGLSNIPNFEMGEEPMNDEENDGDDFYHGDELTFKKGILYTVESGEVAVEAIDEDDAKEKVQENEDCVAIFFDGFTKGMYGYQGTAADGKGYKWDWDGYDINESNTSSTKYNIKINIKNMKRIKLYEEFLNESKKEKMSSATYWEDVNISGVGVNNTVKSNNDSTKAAQALVDYFEKGKSFDKGGFSISAERLKMLEDISKYKTDEVITLTIVDGKTNKDYQIKMEVRDTALGVPNKNIYTWVSRVG